MSDVKVVAIIQARMGSTRFPGKVLFPLAGRPVLWHVIHRLRKAKSINCVAIATSTNAKDDPLVEFAERMNAPCVRGPEDNVLARYVLAAERLHADVVIRVTGDAPLVDPEVIDLLVKNLLKEKADYCIADPDVPVIHEGFCPFTVDALRRVAQEGAADPVAREHVSAYFKKHPESFHITHISLGAEHHFQGARISVDTPADFRFLEAIYRKLNVPAGDANIIDIVRLLKEEPNLLEINQHIYQKKAVDKTHSVFFLCDGNSRIGLGHVVRCVALAERLRDGYGYGVTFIMSDGKAGIQLVQESGFPVIYKGLNELSIWFADLPMNNKPDAFVLDTRNDLSCADIVNIKKQGILIVIIDNSKKIRIEADLVFYPPVPQVRDLDWHSFAGHRYVGWEWVILRQQFATPQLSLEGEERHLLITMGGSDPAGLTEKVIDIMENNNQNFTATIVVGNGNSRVEKIDQLVQKATRSLKLRTNVKNMASLMSKADLAIATFGVTAYELAAIKTPMILLCLDDDHSVSASIFEQEGMARAVAIYKDGWEKQLAVFLREIMGSKEHRRDIKNAAQNKVDGRGANRIAQVIVDSFGENKNDQSILPR